MRPGDTIARLSGDEFVVLLEAPDGAEEARRVAQRIRDRLQRSIETGGREVFIRSSIGIALSETAEDQPEEVLRHADLAMYTAKNRGKDRYELYDPGMDIWAQESMGLESDLRRALEREELEVH